MTNIPATRTTSCERTAGVGDPRCRWDSPEPMRPYALSLSWVRVVGVPRLQWDSPEPMHHQPYMSEWGGSSAGALTHECQDRTWGGASPEPRGGGRARTRTASVGTDVRQPGTAIHVLNSHGPGSGGTVPLPQTLLAPQCAQPLYSPVGAVTHGLAVGEVTERMGGRRHLSFSLW